MYCFLTILSIGYTMGVYISINIDRIAEGYITDFYHVLFQ